MDNTRNILARFSAAMATVGDVHRTVCDDVIAHVGSTRAGIWYFGTGAESLKSACIADQRHGVNLDSIELSAADFPGYFDAIKNHTFVKAPDAMRDPATSCFSESYFKPLGIRSLLDFVIKVGPTPVAVLCCEHCGDVRGWSREDQDYLHNMAVLLKLSFLVQHMASRRQVA
jgi:GAF domain-containing protein